MKPDQCIVCKRRNPDRMMPVFDHEERRVAGFHGYHRLTTWVKAGIFLKLKKIIEPGELYVGTL